MFVILTSRPGQYHTEISDGLRVCESYDYQFCGETKARFIVAMLLRDMKIRLVDDAPPGRVNEIPSKLLPRFETLDEARAQLASLVGYGGLDSALRRVA